MKCVCVPTVSDSIHITRKWLALFTQYIHTCSNISVVSEGVSLSMHSFYTYCDNGFGTGQLRMEYQQFQMARFAYSLGLVERKCIMAFCSTNSSEHSIVHKC